ncbi:Fcf2 pre-rRNA processing-domain-containing protein [Mycena maculata]|uniref:Fcf2 pre-rRNA processing-domain-containing protein n=1 Tax=Mycena maculata TaxID=230809 RepID=A0AAD7NG52_9AGAR|nr:Fcf2 pre-rRNA processing-domain-containing protein [Mycena maculata]
MSNSGKGKERAIELFSDSEPEVTPEYLESLLNKARENARVAKQSSQPSEDPQDEDDVIVLQKEPAKIPALDPGVLPRPYFTLEKRKSDPYTMRDPDVELAEKVSSSYVVPAPPIPPPELTKSGKPLTKRERKELKNQTAGPDWFDLPAPAEADLPRLYREVEALRLRNHLDPKRFYRKDEGEGKGIKGLPKHFAIGTIITATTPFGTPSGDNLPRSSRKRTLVDELVDDAEAKRYAKKKFEDLQAVRGAKGRNTLTAKKASRRGKW